jgi:dipeptidyl aminopeptidase/acylaminoacyl peptidase
MSFLKPRSPVAALVAATCVSCFAANAPVATGATGALPAAPAASAALAGPAAPVPASGPAAPRLPVEAYAKRPQFMHVTLAPDGKRFAALVNRDNDGIVVVRELDGEHPLKPIFKPNDPKLSVRWLRWVGDRLLVSLSFPGERNGVETVETRMVSMRADGSDMRKMFPPDLSTDDPPQFTDSVIDALPDGRHVLVEVRGLPEDIGMAVYSLDVETGRRERVQSSEAYVDHWVVDQAHRVRAGVRLEKTTISLVVRPPEGGSWTRLFERPVLSGEEMDPLGFGRDPNVLYVSGDHDGKRAVYAMDLGKPGQPRTLKLADEDFDTDGSLIVSPRTHEPVGIQGGSDNTGNAYWDEDYRSLARGLSKALPDRTNTLLQVSDDEGRYLVLSEGNGIPPEYYLGDTRTHSLDRIARTYPQLPEATLVRRVHLTLHARDGLALPAWLTLPAGSTGRHLPAVVLPHGGPISNDEDGFDPWTQFLANRGLAVLQVDFRGSSGHGRDFMTAGLKRWGLEMQDDITDATRWLVDSGVADPKRVCIVGGSYGGYAALMGAIKTPDLYRCAVSFAGVTDLYALADEQENFMHKEVFEQQVASKEGDMIQMRRTSPRYLADQVHVPVLLVHGTLDRSVPYAQSEVMASALKSAGKDVRFVTQQGGDHHLSRYAQSLEFLTELDKFLGQQLALTP